MKKYAILLILALVSTAFAARYFTKSMTAPTAFIAGNSTNIVSAADLITYGVNFGDRCPDLIEIYVSATGTTATTNGVRTLIFGKSTDGTNYTSAHQSSATVTLTMATFATNSPTITTRNNDILYLAGSPWVCLVGDYNGTSGAWSNTTFTLLGKYYDR